VTPARARAFLRELNECWRTGDLGAIAAFYHPDVVLLPPDLGEPICGRDAVVATYGDFLQAASLQHFEITGIDVFPFDTSSSTATCMAHLAFDVSYRLGDETYVEKGLEVYTLSESDGELKILWRYQSVLDSRIESKA